MRSRVLPPLLLSILCALGLAAIYVVSFRWGRGHGADSAALEGFVGLDRPSVFAVTDRFAHLADPLPFALLLVACACIALARGRFGLAIAVVVAAVGANLSTQILKPLLADPRFAAFLGSDQISEGSWPSGHATASMSIALALILVSPPRARPFAAALGAIYALGVSFSILIMAWHYPSDVIGGYLVAGTWMLAAGALTRAVRLRRPRRRRDDESLVTTLAPLALTAAAGLVVVAVLAATRPANAVSYADLNTTFVAAAIVIAGMCLGLAGAVAAAWRG
jgi:membrane-associated phospholipid phosphatase